MTQLYFGHLSAQTGVAHAITTRHGGLSEPPFDTLNLAYHVGDSDVAVRANRLLAAKALGVDAKGLVFMNQVHGNEVVCISAPPEAPLACDALITDTPGLTLGIMVADCVPLIFYDPQNRAIGVAHAGWKGTLLQIAAQTVHQMAQAFKSRPEKLLVGIGPCIGGDCYEVDEKVADPWQRELPEAFYPALKKHGKDRWRLDLQRANRLMLQETGVPDRQIETMALCTHCEPSLYSYRRDQKTGRFAGLISLR